MSMSSLTAALPPDGRQSPTALAIARGTTRLLHSLGFSAVSELPLASGRRADLVALGAKGDVWIVEIKSSIADFRADQKWMDYRRHCDRLFFATTLEVPCDIFPLDAGLIVADAFGASIVCEAPEHRLHPPSRKAMTLAFARVSLRRALGQNALQGAAMHVEPARRLGDVAAAKFIDALNVLPADSIG